MFLTFATYKLYPINLIFLASFTVLEGYTISIAVSSYDPKMVLQAVLLTAGVFVGLMLFACQSMYDFTSWMLPLAGGLWALIPLGILTAFFPFNTTVQLIGSGIGALIFSVYVVQRILFLMERCHVGDEIVVRPYFSLVSCF
jgi:protein lifeguard